VNPEKAALAVADYQSAIGWASQTALRDVIGKTMLSDMLEGRDKISALLQAIIDARTQPWGISVQSVEVKDVLIPASLEDAMWSRCNQPDLSRFETQPKIADESGAYRVEYAGQGDQAHSLFKNRSG
jgi:regulator of protease activity HflC (stomatin/prohibitin superfamily)